MIQCVMYRNSVPGDTVLLKFGNINYNEMELESVQAPLIAVMT